jgi:hypothetical protein
MSATSRYASAAFGPDLAGSPAIVMAMGIFLLYAARFLLDALFDVELVNGIVWSGAILLGMFSGYLAMLFIVQLKKDHTVLWDYSPNFFRIGTWVAGTNVLARVLQPLSPIASTVLSVAGWILWLLYMLWLLRTALRIRPHEMINGTAFLTTVATQSVVLNILGLWTEHNDILLLGLLVLNALGIVLYCVFFYSIWIVRGVKLQIAHWVPQNNITHGALSISLLAAEMIVARTVTPSPLLLTAIDAIWVVDAVLFLVIAVTELWLAVSGVKSLLSFQVSNYARNFTYGMFFACTYYGYTYLETSIMNSLFNPEVLLALAGAVFIVNVWEVSRQMIKYRKLKLAFDTNE